MKLLDVAVWLKVAGGRMGGDIGGDDHSTDTCKACDLRRGREEGGGRT